MSQAETLAGNLANTLQKPIMPVIETTFSEIKTPEIPELTSEINFIQDGKPKFENQSVEIKFIDNLDSIIEKIRNLTDKILHIDAETRLTQVQNVVSPEYHLPELPDLSLNADTSIIDKIKEILESPLFLSVRLADGFENIRDMFTAESLAMPEMDAVRRYNDNYISYQGSNGMQNGYRNSYTTVQEMTVTVPGININSDSDMDTLADILVERLAERLDSKSIYDSRGTGGTGVWA
jgi:hypothetical protein